MRPYVFCFFIFLMTVVLVPVRARSDTESVRIVTDQTAASFNFMIDGQEVARLDKAGLHIHGDIVYDGILTDTGARMDCGDC